MTTAALVKVVIQVTDTDLTPKEQAAEVQGLYENLQAVSEMQGIRINFLERVSDEGNLQFGVRFTLAGEQVRAALSELCDRIEAQPVEVLVTLYIDAMTLQVKTRDVEELAATTQAAELLLPPRRTFLAKAETYARSYGEFSPAEIANLEWIRQQLDIPVEEAALLLSRALGPYRSRQDKQRRYREVLLDEFNRQFPPTDESRETLKEYAANLRLPPEDAAAIYEEVLNKIQDDAEEKRRQEQAEQITRLQIEKTRLEDQLEQQAAAERQTLVKNYRTEYSKAIATSLYPLQFDQGRLEQARRIWEISPEEAQAIEREETAILYGDIQSAIGADYSRLRELLWQGDWLEADRETERALLRAFSLGQRALSADPSLQDVRLIDQWTLEQLPCLDLITIDQLWSLHSEEHFGFKVQAQIFEELQRQPHDFLRAVGWAEGLSVGNTPIFKSTRSYSDLDFSRQAPDGHLPTWRWCCPSLEGGYVVEDAFIDAFMSRLINTCQLLGQVSPQS